MISVLLLIWLPGHLLAQFDQPSSRVNTAYLDTSFEAATHLLTAASYATQRNWSEAIDLYQKLIESFGDKVVQVGSSSVYVSVRDYCHRQIASMPPEARAMYRVRVDAQAENWYRAGVRDRDRELLTRVLDRAFVSSWGDNALDALAELCFESGQFEESLLLWRQIDTGATPHEGEKPAEGQPPGLAGLVYPDTDLDRPLIEAKKILCQLFMGKKELALEGIAEYRKRTPSARGTLGAADGLLADRLAGIARDISPIARAEDGLWTTFAGNAQRSKVVPRAVEIGSVQWTAPLTFLSPPRLSMGGRPMQTASEEPLSYHPLVLRDWVLVCGREEVRAYELHASPKKGDEPQPVWSFKLRDLMGQATPAVFRSAGGAPHYTMTADRSRLYVRLGAPETTLPFRRGGQPDSYLVCLDLTAEAKEVWRIQPEPNEPDLAFEGSPIVTDGNVYVGVTRGGAMTHSFVACYDAATGAKKWRQLVCEASSATSFYQPGSITHNLPTLGAGMVFYNSNLGAIAALDQRTGRVRWIATYPRTPREDMMPSARGNSGGSELSPCIYYDGLVIAMPSDGQGVHAFDALTGELRWRTLDPPHFAHMLGVAHGNLICTGNQVMAIDVASGKRAWQWVDSSGMAAYGRGILAGEYVYYPTKTHIFIIDQRTGLLAKPKVVLQDSQTPGNLVLGEGYLVVAQAKNLTVFCQYEVLINRYRDLIVENPHSADPHFRLARAADANGNDELAVEHYRATIELTTTNGPEEDRAIRQVAQTQLFSLLVHLGQNAAKERNWARAEQHYREAADLAPSSQGRLDALLGLADEWRTAGEAAKPLEIFQELLADDSLRGLTIQVEANRSVRVDVEVANRVEALLKQFGHEIYARFDAAANEVFAEAQQNGSLPTAERLLRTHPNAQVVTQTLLFLATQHAANGQHAAAIASYKQLLARPNTPVSLQVVAMQGIAQAHESQRSWNGARVWWQKLAQGFSDAPLPSKPEQSVASFVAEHLSQPPYAQESGPGADKLQLPLARKWNRLWGEDSHVSVPQGASPSGLGLLLLVSNRESLECVASRSGEPIWDMRIAGPVRWAAFQEDNLLIGTDSQFVCVDAAKGELMWQQKTSTGLPDFSEFHLVDDRIFLREDTRKLTCLAAGAGTTLWTYTPTEGAILPHSFFSGLHVALRTQLPGKFVVLDGDGRRRIEVTQTGVPWDQAPVALDAHRICLASDARTVQLVDLNDGKPVWSYMSPSTDQKPVPIVSPGCLLALVGGSNLIRLNSETGEPMWSSRVSDDVLSKHPNVWAVDGQTFFCITRELNLRAFRLADGEFLWEQALVGPGEEWQLVATGGYVAALPRKPHATEGLPVVLCRQSDGSLVQRLFFRPHGSEAIIHLASDQAVIGSDREVWALGRE